MKFIIYYYALINIFSFFIMGIDKFKAKKNRFRIPEKHLLFYGIAGGALGALLGMEYFRHKTKHGYFRVTYFVSSLIHFYIILRLYKYLGG